ncbi:MAG: hypothetical protein ONB27_05480 [candidate division KSB1 bacterium]|nr:hypothetical protein [candidate division KSB1 bacterium]
MSTMIMLLLAAIIFFWQPPFRVPAKVRRLVLPGVMLLLAILVVSVMLKATIQKPGVQPVPREAETTHKSTQPRALSF